MFPRFTGGASALLLVFALSASLASAASTPAAGQLRVAINSASHTSDFSATASRNQFVILNEWEQAKMRDLKAENPAIKVLMYKNLSFMAPVIGGNVGTGVSLAEADAHPSWYLKNTAGERFSSWSFDWQYAADIGDPSYQQRWVDNVLPKLTGQGWDGVFVDDVNPTMQHHYDVAAVAKYPTDAAYSAATGSAVAAIGPKIRAAGKLVIANFGDWRRYRSTVGSWLGDVSGGMEEQFTKWGSSTTTGYLPKADWENQLAILKDTQARGKQFLGVMHSAGGDAAAARYGWASLLLGAEGRASFTMAPDYTDDHAFPEYGYALGAAKGPESVNDAGVHRRQFANGLVVVNPTSAPVAVTFGGAYSGSGLKNAEKASIGPSSGLVLLKDNPGAGGATIATVTTTTAVDPPQPAGSARAAAPAPPPAPPAVLAADGSTMTRTSVDALGVLTKTTATTSTVTVSRHRRTRAKPRSVTDVNVGRTPKSKTPPSTWRKRASCPVLAQNCRVNVRVKITRANVLVARGSRKVTVQGGGKKTISVRLRRVEGSTASPSKRSTS